MTDLWPEHEDAKKWEGTLKDFAYEYFKPACFDNPFYLLPVGYYKNVGLLNFSCLWHGMNGTYGSAAALTLEFAEFTGDEDFNKIAVDNLQWTVGLNAGVKEGEVMSVKV